MRRMGSQTETLFLSCMVDSGHIACCCGVVRNGCPGHHVVGGQILVKIIDIWHEFSIDWKDLRITSNIYW